MGYDDRRGERERSAVRVSVLRDERMVREGRGNKGREETRPFPLRFNLFHVSVVCLMFLGGGLSWLG